MKKSKIDNDLTELINNEDNQADSQNIMVETEPTASPKDSDIQKSDHPEEDAAVREVSLLPVHEILLLAADFEPNTKQDLNDMVSKLWNHSQRTTLVISYLIGTLIKKGREKWTYGEKDMEKLAKSLGIGSSNLYKACKFAEQYSDDQIRQLINGKFVMSWRNIAQNQTVPSDDLLKIYGEAESSGQFCNAVTKFKEEANSSKEGSGGNQSNGESQRGDDDNTPEQDENEGTSDQENLEVADSSSSEGDKAEEPILEERQQDQESIEEDGQQETDENEPESAEDVEDSEDDYNSSPESEVDESQPSSVDLSQTDDVQALTAKISEHEKSIMEKDQRIEELEMENTALKVRIQELEEQ